MRRLKYWGTSCKPFCSVVSVIDGWIYRVQVKLKSSLCLIPHHIMRYEGVDSITPRPLYPPPPRDTASGIWCVRGWVSARASLDVAQSPLLYNSLTETSAFKVFHLAIMSVTKALQHEWYIDEYEYGALVQQYWQEKTEALGQKPVCATLPTTNPTRTDLGSNPSIRDVRTLSNHRGLLIFCRH